MRQEGYTAADEDLRLVSLSQKGDLGAFEELVRRHEKEMINVVYKMGGNYEEACDIAQDTFISAYKNIKSFKGTSRFSTWLCAIVINLSKKRLKELKTQRLHEPVSTDAPVTTVADNRMIMDPPSNNPLADEVLERKEIQKKIQLCLDRLEDEFREVVILRDMRGFFYEDISITLKIAEGTVKSRLFRGRVLVKNCLKRFMRTI